MKQSYSSYSIAHILLLCLLLPVASASDEVGLYRLWSHGGGAEWIYPEDEAQWLKALPDAVLRSDGWEVQIDYKDLPDVGFRDPLEGAERQARLQDAISYVMDVLNIDPELGVVLRIEVKASLLRGNSGFISQGGTLYGAATNFTNGIAYLKLTTGSQPFPDYPELSLRVDFGHNWYSGTGLPAANQFDLHSVLLHELTHGLGIATSSDAKGNSQLAGLYTYWDSLLYSKLFDDYLFGEDPVTFLLTPTALVNPVAFNGEQARRYYAQEVRPPVYAPSLFQSGSSLSHWDTGRIVGEAVMEHAFRRGVVRRKYAPLDLGALYDLGYTNIDPRVGEGEGEGEIEDPDPPVLHVAPLHHVGINYGDVPISSFSDGLWTVTNHGGGLLQGDVSVIGKGFNIVGESTYALAPGESTSIIIRFTPQLQAEYTGAAIFDNNADVTTIQVVLMGNGYHKILVGCHAASNNTTFCTRNGKHNLLIAMLVVVILLYGSRYRFC